MIQVNCGYIYKYWRYEQKYRKFAVKFWVFATFIDFIKYWTLFSASGLFPKEALTFLSHLVNFEKMKDFGKYRKTVLKEGKQTQICPLPASSRPNTGSQLGPPLGGIGGKCPPFHQIR